MEKLRAAVIGGGAGGALSMNALNRSHLYELVAMADTREEVQKQWKKEFPEIATFSSHQELFASCPVDVVCVSTYPPSHEEITLAALSLPLKGILVEKPIGDTAASGKRIIQAIKQKAIPVVVPHGLLAQRTPTEVIRLVREGAIGPLKLVEVQCNKWDIMNAGIHWIHFFIQLTGLEPVDFVMAACEGSTRTYRDGMQVETTGVTYAVLKNGIRLVMETGDDVAVSREGKELLFRLAGDGGTIEFYGWESGYRLVNRENPQGVFIVPEEFPVKGHQYYLEQMAEMIRQGEYDYRIADSSLTALEVCEGAYLSAKHQAKVKFPFDAESVHGESWEMGVPYSGTGGGRDGRKL